MTSGKLLEHTMWSFQLETKGGGTKWGFISLSTLLWNKTFFPTKSLPYGILSPKLWKQVPSLFLALNSQWECGSSQGQFSEHQARRHTNQQGFVGTPLIMHSSVLTTCKGFIRTCWIFCLFCLNLFIFNGRIIAWQYSVGFSIHQHESAIGIHMFPCFQVVTEPWFEFPESFSKFPLVIYFPYGNMFPCYSLYSLLSSQPHLLPSAHVHKSRTGWTLSCSSNCWIKSNRCL